MPNTNNLISLKVLISYFKLLLLSTLCSFGAGAQVIVPFNPRASYHTPNRTIYNIRGDFAMLGNKNLTLRTYFDNGANSNSMIYVDVDNDPNTINSSWATLQFSDENNASPECSKILFAGLYWTGRAHGGNNSPNSFTVINQETGLSQTLTKGTVLFKHEDAPNYTEVQASPDHARNIYFPTNDHANIYSAFAEVTDYVRQYGLGKYFVADLALTEGRVPAPGLYGGWGMIVVYENPAMNWRDITIFDGHGFIVGNSEHLLPVSGFRTLQQGQVNLKLGLMAGEGDRTGTGDFFSIRNAADDQWIRLSHSGNQTNNFFNGSILTGGHPRNPNLLNNLGMDVVMFNVPNPDNSIITNNQTASTFLYGSTSETYIIFCIAIATDAYIPDVEAFHRVETIDNGPVQPGVQLQVTPGQVIEFSLEIRNKEQEDIHNFAVTIPIPFATTYVSSTGEFFQGIAGGTPIHDPTAGPTGSIIWNIGTLPKQSNTTNLLAKLTYSLKVTEDCFILSNQSCNLEVIVAVSTSGQGVTTGISFDNIPLIQGYIDDGSNCQGFPITDPISLEIFRDDFIDSYCQPLQNYITRNFEFCNLPGTSIPFARVSANFPAGTRFFNTINPDTGQPTTGATEYNINTGFPIIQGNQSYFASPPGSTSCYWQFSIFAGQIEVSDPEINTFCFGEPISITIFTTGVTKVGPTINLPDGVSLSYSNNKITISGTPGSAGTFNFMTTLEGECDGFFARGTIVIQDPVTAGQIIGGQEICHGTAPSPITNQISGSGSGPFAYIWQSSTTGANGVFNDIPGQSNSDYQPGALTQTTWFRRITVSSINSVSCQSQPTNPVEINVANEIQFSASVSNRITCHDDHNGEITIIATGGDGTLQYSLNDQDFYTQNVFGNLPPGQQTVFVRDQRGCKVNSSMSLENPPLLVLQATQTAMVRCKGETNASVSLSGNGGWGGLGYSSNGVNYGTSQVFQNLGASTLTFFVRDVEGCTTSQTLVISEPVIELTARLVGQNNAICHGQPSGSATVEGLNGWGAYSYSWDTQPAQNTATANSLPAGTFVATITDRHGCSTQVSIQITQPQPVMITNIEVSDVHCKRISEGGKITFDVEGGAVSPFTFLWSNGQTNGALEGVQSGVYSVMVTDFYGCRVQQSFELIFLDEDCKVVIPQGFSPNGDGKNDRWFIKNLYEEHPNNRLKVYNRNGSVVFEAAPYKDDWDGTPNRGNVWSGRNGKVPPGVYFYQVWLSPDAKPISGYLFVLY